MIVTKLDDLQEKEIVPGIKGKFVHSDNMTIVYWFIDAGAVMLEHGHPHEQIVNVLEGEFDLIVESKTHEAKQGFVAVVPPNAKHGGKAKTKVRILDVFYPVREDYR